MKAVVVVIFAPFSIFFKANYYAKRMADLKGRVKNLVCVRLSHSEIIVTVKSP